MRSIRTAMATLLALTWVLVSSHCLLEGLPGFEFLRCATDAGPLGESGDPCTEKSCCSVESAQYHAPRHQEVAPVILVAILPSSDLKAVDHSPPKEVSLGILTAAPPEMRSAWQFSFRTALPVRAPSSAS